MFLIITLKDLVFRVSLFVACGTFINLIGSNKFLESFHNESSFYIINGKSGEGIDSNSLKVSQPFRLGRHRGHQVTLADAWEHKILKKILCACTDILSSFLISKWGDLLKLLKRPLDNI